MLGIFLIICLAAFWFIELKAYDLLRDERIEPIDINIDSRTYNVCHRAGMLYAVCDLIILLGYIGCAWPYLFIEGIDRVAYLAYIAMFGITPILLFGYSSYAGMRNAQGYIRIGADEIEYKRHKSFSVKVSDIKKIVCLRPCAYQIHLKEKGKKPLLVNLNGFYKKKEICSLVEQLRDHVARVYGRDRGFFGKIGRALELTFPKYYLFIFKIVVVLLLLYTSYCCIDYDFFRKDYTALFNALGAEPNQSENAWPYYVQAAGSYIKAGESLQESIDCAKSEHGDLDDNQKENLRKWFDENASSWASLNKAVSINYCNATYKHISLGFDITDRRDFSSPSDSGYGQIRHLYGNANAGRLAGVLDLDWFDLFQMQLASARHFVDGKSFVDQLVGYAMLGRSLRLLAEQDSYKLEDLQQIRASLKERFPAGVPPLNIEGEIFIMCSTFDSMVNFKKIPVQTPLNPVFLVFGSSTGTEAYARKHYRAILEQARKGIEVDSKGFSILSFPIGRNACFRILEGAVGRVYKTSQKAGADLAAAYVVLDLKEYKLMKGDYPADINQLRQAGLTSELPDDPDREGKIIYRNDGQRAILYAVGPNGKDDGGYKDEKGPKEKRDDMIYWQRKLKNEATP
jgi:hypothetical protein